MEEGLALGVPAPRFENEKMDPLRDGHTFNSVMKDLRSIQALRREEPEVEASVRLVHVEHRGAVCMARRTKRLQARPLRKGHRSSMVRLMT